MTSASNFGGAFFGGKSFGETGTVISYQNVATDTSA